MSRDAGRPAPPATGDIAAPARLDLYADLLRIRRLEESLLDLFSKGALFGTTHTSIGQEAIAVAAMHAIDRDRDIIFSSHRCHGHFLAYGGDPVALLAEIMGRTGGVCRGWGGSQHLHFRNFHSSGVQGGIVPLGVGAAMAESFRASGALAVVFLGDGTLGEGATYEALNMASLWSVPVLFVLEDNGYAQSTPRALGVAGSMTARAEAFGIEAHEVTTNDVEELLPLMRDRVDGVRGTGRPFFQVIRTYRLAPHSKGDDDRDPKEIEAWRACDPLRLIAGRIGEADREAVAVRVEEEVTAAIRAAEASPWPDADAVAPLMPLDGGRIPGDPPDRLFAPPDATTGIVSVGRDLNAALHAMMRDDDRVVVIGEDLIDPYGGAFKVTRGLSTQFPRRVLTTPISEAGLVGAANGMALRGLRPVAEIMFGDFICLAADQIVNHAAKFAGMYAGQASCPVTIRAPMGGRRGYGPTHSQSLEAIFLGVPGLEVVAVSALHAPGALLANAVLGSDRPTLFIEYKGIYPLPVRRPDETGCIGAFTARTGGGLYPTVHLSLTDHKGCDLVIVTYGGSAGLAMEAAEELMVEEEIACDVLVVSQLSPCPIEDLLGPVLDAGRALLLEEGPRDWGWGSEVSAMLHERAGPRLTSGRIDRLGARAFPIPVSRPLEDHVLPQKRDILDRARALMAR